ncbi:fungal-specific transcription factor domain-containing protein [Amylostereum chailletii]|nr:fungal-specific transcription factor domain-containing protein [Amylostereum chailletii]
MSAAEGKCAVTGVGCQGIDVRNVWYTILIVPTWKKRGPPKGYVEGLERRLKKMESLLKEVRPDIDPRELAEGDSPSHDLDVLGGPSSSSFGPKPFSGVSKATARRYSQTPILTLDPDSLESSDVDQADVNSLTESLKNANVGSRFFGKSSDVHLIRTTLDLKKEYTGQDEIKNMKILATETGKPAFLDLRPWEKAEADAEEELRYSFPDTDLLQELLRLYFEHINVFTPLLHQPTFEMNVQDGLHYHDAGFAEVLLLACACASRYSTDPRVVLSGTGDWTSSGWYWFKQVNLSSKSLLVSPRIYDLQKYSLGCTFLQGCSAPQACWTLCGFGIRVAQDVGAHRRKVYSATPTVENELWKRAFWILFIKDRAFSAAFGRPCAIQEEDIDVDLPAECDDEYWTHPDPAQAFKQPAGKPSKASFFIASIKLHQIQGTILRTIYSINKSKVILGFIGPDWEQHTVAELDSALNQWVDSVPDHIRWDPAREDTLFFMQSACLFSNYYQVQIMVHRPFIPSPNKPSPLSFPSLAICTNAARSCSHIVGHLQRRKDSPTPGPDMHIPAFAAGAVLLLSIWGARHSGTTIDPAKEMEDVYRCMKMLKDAEARWLVTGRLWDILYDLASVGDLPLPRTSPGRKRTREEAARPSTSSSAVFSAPPLPATFTGLPPPINTPSPGSDNAFGSVVSNSRAYPPVHETFPMHSDELGRMPTHPNSLPVDLSWFQQRPSGRSQTAQVDRAQPFAYQGGMFDPQTLGCFDSNSIGVGENTTDMVNGPNAAPGLYDAFAQPLLAGQGVTTDPVDVWGNAPSCLEDWDSYITNMAQHPPPPAQQHHSSDNRGYMSGYLHTA